jgi:hypothetical protein
MTGMDALHLIAENKIRAAQREGAFDNLAGAGKPLPPDDAERVPEDLRVGYRVLKNAGVLPVEIELRKSIVRLGDLLRACTNDREAGKLRRELRLAELRYALAMKQ